MSEANSCALEPQVQSEAICEVLLMKSLMKTMCLFSERAAAPKNRMKG